MITMQDVNRIHDDQIFVYSKEWVSFAVIYKAFPHFQPYRTDFFFATCECWVGSNDFDTIYNTCYTVRTLRNG